MTTYKQSGVDIEAGEEMVRRIKKNVRSTFNRNVLADIGMFGALYRASFKGIKNPVLVTSVDGVGTKLKIAFAMDRHDTVGQDLVNHCVNDILVCGAKPLYFLDYFATGKLHPKVGAQVISGFVKACRENGCALIGGETAEMPGMYAPGEYDLAGTIVGVVGEHNILNGKQVRSGDVLVGLPSTGLHTNGFSLARAVLLKKYSVRKRFDELGGSLGDALLNIHRSYYNTVYPLLSNYKIKAMSHITGGGIEGNTMRVVPQKFTLKIDWRAWEWPTIFKLLQQHGQVPGDEMQRVFNLGIGLVIVAKASFADEIQKLLTELGEKNWRIGKVIAC